MARLLTSCHYFSFEGLASNERNTYVWNIPEDKCGVFVSIHKLRRCVKKNCAHAQQFFGSVLWSCSKWPDKHNMSQVFTIGSLKWWTTQASNEANLKSWANPSMKTKTWAFHSIGWSCLFPNETDEATHYIIWSIATNIQLKSVNVQYQSFVMVYRSSGPTPPKLEIGPKNCNPSHLLTYPPYS